MLQAEKERDRIEYEKCEKKKATKQKNPDAAMIGSKRKCISDNLEILALKATKQVTLHPFLSIFCPYDSYLCSVISALVTGKLKGQILLSISIAQS